MAQTTKSTFGTLLLYLLLNNTQNCLLMRLKVQGIPKLLCSERSAENKINILLLDLLFKNIFLCLKFRYSVSYFGKLRTVVSTHQTLRRTKPMSRVSHTIMFLRPEVLINLVPPTWRRSQVIVIRQGALEYLLIINKLGT